MDLASLQQNFEAQMIRTAEMLESQVDHQLRELDNLDEDDFERLRQRRLLELKAAHNQRQTWVHNGHGEYAELADQRDFFDAAKKSEHLVVHFYRPTTWRCEIVDKHLRELSKRHVETRFVRINAEKSPFLTERLSVTVLPTLLIIAKAKVVDRVVGFDDLGGRDDFKTDALARRLRTAIKYDGDVYEDGKKTTAHEHEDYDLYE